MIQIEQEIYRDFLDPVCCTKPKSLIKRGGGGYSDIALGLISAIYNDKNSWIVVNVPNRGIVSWLPDDAVIETPCLVNGDGIRPLQITEPPKAVRGLITAVKTYEQLAIEAAVTGNIQIAEQALLAHPLVKDWDIIQEMLPQLLAANRQYLPNFNL